MGWEPGLCYLKKRNCEKKREEKSQLSTSVKRRKTEQNNIGERETKLFVKMQAGNRCCEVATVASDLCGGS